MSFPKHALFTEEDQVIARLGFAMAHPARLYIARTLYDDGPQFVQDLESKMPLVQASISHHLRVLRQLEILKVEERRLFNEYHLNLVRLVEVNGEFDKWFRSFSKD